MTNQNNRTIFGKASIKFMLVAVGITLLALLITWLIITINQGFTYWAIIPLAAGFPITLLINMKIAKKTIANVKNVLKDEGIQDEEVN